MKAYVFYVLLAVLVAAAGPAEARKPPLLSRGSDVDHGAAVAPSKAIGDTLLICGPWNSGAPYNGQFESPLGSPAWNGWTHADKSCLDTIFWTISDYHAADLGEAPAPDNHAAWCGYPWAACDKDDAEGGYGNNWHQILEWRTTVLDPGASTTVAWDFFISWDTEVNYDFVYIYYLDAGGTRQLAALDQSGVNAHQDYSFTYLGGDYAGDSGNEIIVQIAFISDRSYSDEDCLHPSVGACQVDDISVRLNGDLASFTDFEAGFGEWTPRVVAEDCVGDFAMLRNNLEDLDPCNSNPSYQVTFIDDGIVVPGTGGSSCINWCYGPDGFIVTPDGGLAGPGHQINNWIYSPVMPWPDPAHDGGFLYFDVYQHEDLDADSPGILLDWAVRSTDSPDPGQIAYASFRFAPWFFFNTQEYQRDGDDITDLLVQNRTYVQCAMRVVQYGYIWGGAGLDGYPAPYVDNVRMACYHVQGPALTARLVDLAQDVFPEAGILDPANPGASNCRFDMALNISPSVHLRNDPGDSIVVGVTAVRSGSNLYGPPRLLWSMAANTLFDPQRTSVYGTARSGETQGWQVGTGKFAFDLPDSGFLFPGDVLHYCIVAQDRIGGQDIGTSILPADTTGFHDFSSTMTYDARYTVHCLPSVYESAPGIYSQPGILFWNDQDWSFVRERWLHSLRQVLDPDHAFDIYETSSAASGAGNGLGGRAGSAAAISGYHQLIYTCGVQNRFTISNGDFDYDAGDDIGLLNDWLQTGGRNIFASGDNLVSDLVYFGGAETAQFAADCLGVSLVGMDLRHLINNQAVPQVRPLTPNPVLNAIDSWLVYGDCDNLHGKGYINTLDAVLPTGAGQRIAEFSDPVGTTGVYPYSAGTLTRNPLGLGNDFISLPYDLAFIFPDIDPNAKTRAPITSRSLVLHDALMSLGYLLGTTLTVGTGDDAPAARAFAVQAYPNPFNPQTRLGFNMPQEGHLNLKVFNIRGELVQVLVDEIRPAGPGQVQWDGTDRNGAIVASGLYFFEARALGLTRTGKLVVVR